MSAEDRNGVSAADKNGVSAEDKNGVLVEQFDVEKIGGCEDESRCLRRTEQVA